MTNSWQDTQLGDVLIERKEIPTPESLENGEVGIVSKIRFKEGKIEFRFDGKTKTGMILARPGDLVISGINAIKGAIAVYPNTEQKPIAATIHYGAYIPKKDRVDINYLWWFLRSIAFRDIVKHHIPGGIKTELKAKRFLAVPIPLPELKEQQRILARIDEVAERISKTKKLRKEIDQEINRMLLASFLKISNNAPLMPMSEIAPLVRRPVEVDFNKEYFELGVRSFGNGTFHKPSLNGSLVGTKKLFYIEPNDLVFSNVFAWEGGIAVAKSVDKGRVGSHRFITCVPKVGTATAKYLCYYFLTQEGLEKIGVASPGGAGRNRTLGLRALTNIKVPIPDYDTQLWFDDLLNKVSVLRELQSTTGEELSALLPSVLDKAFKGEL